ncbi:hypothetical protein ES708_07277 [subsurface metagenome]
MKRGQKGFTLVEILVVVAILGVIAVPLAYMTITLLTNPARSNDENVVLQQVRNVGDWISRDVQMARTVDFDEPDVFLTLSIPYVDDNNEEKDYRVDYLFDGAKLKRQLYDSSGNLTSETFIADYIDTAITSFSTVNATGLHQLEVRAIRGEAEITLKYEASQRLISGQQ